MACFANLSCDCFDRFHEPIISKYLEALKASFAATPKVAFKRCEHACSHMDCLSTPRVFAGVPPVSPWAKGPEAPLQCEVEQYERTVRKRALAKQRREEAQGKKQFFPDMTDALSWVTVPMANLAIVHEPCWAARNKAARQEKARLRRLAEREAREAQAPPKFLTIAGVECPAIRGNWMPYMRRQRETRTAHKKRVKDMVAAIKLGRQLREQERWADLNPLTQLKLELAELGYVFCENSYQPLREVVLTGPDTGYVWKKIRSEPKQRVQKVKNLSHAEWCQRMLRKKLRLEMLRQDMLECIPRQRRRLAAVLLRNKKTHVVTPLKSALVSLFEKAVRQDPTAFIDDYETPPVLEGQMDDKQKDAHGENNAPKTDQKSNVSLEDQVGESVSRSLPKSKEETEFSCFAAAKTPVSAKSYVDRWITVKQGIWKSSSQMNSELFSMCLPKDVLALKDFQRSPNYIPFRSNCLWRGNMKVKVMINSNARQYGQLQVRFYYGAQFDKHEMLRDNIYTGSQMPHILINASSSNSGILTIPFEYFNPLMSITQGEVTWDAPPDQKTIANLGKIYCRVVIPLTVAATTPGQCTYSVLIAFEDSQFDGLVDSSMVAGKIEAQMFPIAAAFVLNEVQNALDNNRDNPTMSYTGMPVYPVNTGSWCIGGGLAEWTNVLRLNPNASTPYLEGRAPAVDEMTVDHVKNTFGMIKIIHWSVSHQPGTCLFSFDASPLFGLADYPQFKTDDNYIYCVPPVGVLSSMFSWWRGALDLRIDVVGATELTGRLLVAYIPKWYNTVPMSVAINCTHSIFDLQVSNRQFNFKIPFFSDKLFWERPKTLQEDFSTTAPPGRVFIYVYQELIPNSTIPSDCELVMYLKGGEDFEVAVPALPVIGTSFFPKVEKDSTSTGRVQSKTGYFPIYVGTWHSIGTDIPIFRYGPVSDHVAQFDTQLQNLYIPCKNDSGFSKSLFSGTLTFTVGDKTVTKKYTRNCASALFIKNDGYIYGIPLYHASFHEDQIKLFRDMVVVKCLAAIDTTKDISLAKFTEIYHDYLKTFYTGINFNLYFGLFCVPPIQIADNAVFVSDAPDQGNYFDPGTTMPVFNVDDAYKPIEGQAGDEKSAVSTRPSAPLKTACGRKAAVKVFGERFHDLKDVCRRYQLYASGTSKITESKLLRREIILKFPAMPQGLDLQTKEGSDIQHYWNRTREGPIPLIASGYRFFTGGLRFRVVFNIVTANNKGELTGKVFVQHRPDVYTEVLKVQERQGEEIGTDDIELPGYAAYYQIDTMNNVLNFEIPFYLPIVRSLLQRPIDSFIKWHHLGQIAIGVTLPAVAGILNYEIYYSLADDSRFSVFCGFPPMIDITNIPPVKVDTVKKSSVQIEEISDNKVQTIVEEVVKPSTSEASLPPLPRLPKVEDSLPRLPRLPKVDPPLPKLPMLNDPPMFVDPSEAEYLEAREKYEKIKAKYEGQMGILDIMKFGNTSKAIDVVSQIDPVKANAALDNVVEATSFFQKFKGTIVDSVPTIDSLKNKIDKYMSLIINVVTNFIHCLLNLNIRTICVSVASILTQIKIMSFDMCSRITECLSDIFSTFCSSQQKGEQTVLLEGQMDDDSLIKELQDSKNDEERCIAAYVSTLVAGVAAALAVGSKLSGASWKNAFYIIFDGLKNFALTANCLFTFVKNNLLCIQKIGNWLVDATPSMKDIQFLKDKNKALHEWALEAVELIDPWKEDELFTNVKKASRVYLLHMSGTLLMLHLGEVRVLPAQQKIIEKIFEKLGNLKDRLVKAHRAPPVRFEPFIYELTGKTGVAKSELLNIIPYALLNYTGIKVRGEVIYHRALGNAHWNNCRNQPVCNIDEKFPINQPGFADVQLAELFQLKSRCIFNPPMADLPDKNLRYNPLIVSYASNNCFPNLTGIMDPDAVNRRRDVLVKVQFKPEIIQKYGKNITIKQVNYEERRNFGCLEFWFSQNVLKRQCNWDGPFNYDTFLEKMKNKWHQYYVEENARFKIHLDRAMSLAPDSIDDLKTFEEKWQEACDMQTGELEIKNFREEYYKSISKVNSKEHPLKKEALAFQVIAKHFGNKEQKVDTIEEMQSKIKTFKLQYNSDKDEITKGEPKVEGQGLDGPVPRCASLEHEGVFHNLWSLGPEKVCAHTLAWELIHMKTNPGVTFKYDRKSEVYFCNLELFKAFIDEIDIPGKFITLDWFLKDAGKVMPKENNESLSFSQNFTFKNEKCSNECCPFRELKNRITFINKILSAHPMHKTWCSTLQLDLIREIVPSEFLEHLRSKISESDIKDIEEIKKQVDEIPSWYERAKDKIMSIDWKKWFQRLALILGFFFFIGSILRIFWGSSPVDKGVAVCAAGVAMTSRIQGEVHASGDYKQGAAKKETPRSIAAKTLQSLPEGHMAMGLQRDIYGSLQRNTFCLSMYTESGEFLVGRCIGICGHHALLVDHYWDSWVSMSKQYGTTNMHFIPCSNSKATAISLDFKELKYTKFQDSSLGLLELPLRFNAFKDIRRKIAPKASHAYVNGRGIMAEASNGKGDQVNEIAWFFHQVNFKMSPKMNVKGNQFYSDFETGDCYKYLDFHGKGKCGSLLLASDMHTPIIGIHVAGTTEGPLYGFSECIYQEMFVNLENETPSRAFSCAEGQSPSNWFIDGEVIGVGRVSSFFAHRANEKSRIIPSAVQNDPSSPFPVYTEVAVLSPKDVRIQDAPFSPMLEGCKHHGKPLKPFLKSDLQVAMEDYENLVLAKCIPHRMCPQLLTELEAINGIDGVEGYEHIEWNSSEGFPFVSLRPRTAHNKKWMFTFDEQGKCTGYNSILEQALRKKWAQRLCNIVPETVFTDCLKDCRIAKEKVTEPGKTRIFSISPVDYTIQMRQCTLDFVVAFMANRMNLEHAIGINPDGWEWATLAQNLLTMGDSIVTGDYSKFGDTIPIEIIHGFFRLIINWYKLYGYLSEQHEKQLEIMAYETGNSLHLMFDFLYQVVCGQPSGCPLTVIINSYANSIYQRVAWLSIMRFTPYGGLEFFHKHVKIYSYGDDIIAALSKEIKDLYNAIHLEKFFKEYNLKFTNADKNSEVVKYTNLAEADFLKRGFLPHPYRTGSPQAVLAPLKIESIVDTVNWVNRDSFGLSNPQCENFVEMSKQVCEDALRNAFGRGPQYYEKFRRQLTEFWRSKYINFISSRWEDLDRRVFDDNLNILQVSYFRK